MIDQTQLMTLDELITHAFERFSAAITMWSFFGTVILGVIGLVASAHQVFGRVSMRVLLSIAYAFFAGVNLYILTRIEAQRRVFEEAALPLLSKSNVRDLAGVIDAPPWWLITGIHLSADMAALVAIWLIPIFLRGDRSAE